MSIYIIGSAALKGLFPDFKREPKDLDILVDRDCDAHSVKCFMANCFATSNTRIEVHHIDPLFNWACTKALGPNEFLTLKCSHIFWDINWEKHMFDIVFLFEHGAKIVPELFSLLYNHWTNVHGVNKRSDLNMAASEFFNNALKGKYDHDYLHTIINPLPTYLKVLKDGAEVDVSEEKFNSLSHSEKLELVREEVYVMAYERMGSRSYRAAYAWMLKKFIMSHAPMWEALFILGNYRELHKPIINYKTIIDNAIKNDI